MIFRSDNRTPEQIRPVNIVPDFISTAEGSALIEMGTTRSSVPLRSRRRRLHSWRVGRINLGTMAGFRSERRPNHSTRSQGADTVVSFSRKSAAWVLSCKTTAIGSFRALRQCVLEVIGVLAVGDDDRHGSCDASEPSRARAGHL